MSKPSNISQQRNPAQSGPDSAPPLHSVQDAEGRLLRTAGSVGAFQLGGPILPAKSIVSVALEDDNLLLTADQIVGGEIHVTSSDGGDLQVPSAASIVQYLTQQRAAPSASTAAGAIVNPGSNDTITLTTPSIYVQTFDFSIFVPEAAATIPDLLTNGSCEVRRAGLGVAAAGANYSGLLKGSVAGGGYENRFRAYVLNAAAGSEVVAVVPLNQAQ